MTSIRFSGSEDDAQLCEIDLATWTSTVSPAPAPATLLTFFSDTSFDDVMVAVRDGRIRGYVKIRRATSLFSNEHVWEICGLAVDPAAQRSGIGRALLDEVISEVGRRRARRLTLHVLSTNTGARMLYEACDFVVEGTLVDEFYLDGAYVDDILMARTISG